MSDERIDPPEPAQRVWNYRERLKNDHVGLALEGDRTAIYSLMRWFMNNTHPSYVRPNGSYQVAPEVAQWVREAFRKIVRENVAPAIAFGLKREKSGRPPKLLAKLEEDFGIANDVFDEIVDVGSVDKAALIVSIRRDITHSRARDCYHEFYKDWPLAPHKKS